MDLIERLQSSRTRTLPFYALSEAELSRTYASGKWTIAYQLHHLADAETVLYERIRRTLSEEHATVHAFDQDAWAKGLDYAHFPLDVSRRIYEAARDGVIHQARTQLAEKAALPFVHNVAGPGTLQALFEFVAAHNLHHLEQLEQALSSPQTQ